MMIKQAGKLDPNEIITQSGGVALEIKPKEDIAIVLNDAAFSKIVGGSSSNDNDDELAILKSGNIVSTKGGNAIGTGTLKYATSIDNGPVGNVVSIIQSVNSEIHI